MRRSKSCRGGLVAVLCLFLLSACGGGSGGGASSGSGEGSGSNSSGTGGTTTSGSGTGGSNTGSGSTTFGNSGTAENLTGMGETVLDPTYNATLIRITNQTVNGGTGYGKNIASQHQAFSPDNQYVILNENGNNVVRNLQNYSSITGTNPFGYNDVRWIPNKPHQLIHFDGNGDTTLRLQRTEIDSQTIETVFTFPAPFEKIRPNQSNTEISRDGKWIAGLASASANDQIIFTVNLETNTLGPTFSLNDLYTTVCTPDPTYGQVEPLWVAVSPLGTYLVVQWGRAGATRCSGLETFDLSQNGAFTGWVYDGSQPGDLGVEADGATEFFMTIEASHPADSNYYGVTSRKLPGGASPSSPTYYQMIDSNGVSVSCSGPAAVCLVTTNGPADTANSTFPSGSVFLQYTNGTVQRIAHPNSSNCGVNNTPRASLSRDGKKIIFASDLREGEACTGVSDQAEAYMINLN